MSSKLPKLSFKQTGQNITVSINDGESVLTKVISDKEEREALKVKLNSYIAKKNSTTFNEIEATLKPKTTEDKVAKDKRVEAIKAEIKKNKNAEKNSSKVAKINKNVVKEIGEVVDSVKKNKETKAIGGKTTKALPTHNLVDDLSAQLKAGSLSEGEITKLQELLNKSKKVEAPKASTGTRRSGEY